MEYFITEEYKLGDKTVILREISQEESREILKKIESKQDVEVYLVKQASDINMSDDELKKLPRRHISKMATIISRLSGLSDDEKKE